MSKTKKLFQLQNEIVSDVEQTKLSEEPDKVTYYRNSLAVEVNKAGAIRVLQMSKKSERAKTSIPEETLYIKLWDLLYSDAADKYFNDIECV